MIHILAQNEELALVLKPAGLATQPGAGVKACLIDALEEQWGKRPYLIHRLDQDTEGVMAVALTGAAAKSYSGLIASHRARKVYAAIVAGKMPRKDGVIRAGIMQHGDEKEAVTHYRVLAAASLDGREYGLLELRLETGRMHQIRIHLARSGCPILMDDKHGDFKLNRELKKQYKMKRLLLLAKSLSLGEGKGALSASAPWPEHFTQAMSLLGWDQDSIDTRMDDDRQDRTL
jgi:23S rRNA pseudouridine955/2504/2580 synthase